MEVFINERFRNGSTQLLLNSINNIVDCRILPLFVCKTSIYDPVPQ